MVTAKALASKPRVAVVTVSYRSGTVLEEFLGSIDGASTSRLAVVVSDNWPGGDSAAAASAAAHGARYLQLPDNVGYGGGMSAAVTILPDSVEWILVSNPDVVLGAGALDRLVATGDADATIGAVGPAILTMEGDVYPSARSIPSLRTGIGHALFGNLWAGNPWTRAYRNDISDPPAGRDAGWLSGACVLVRRSAFAELGGFDDSFFMYFEDVDLGFRLGRSGYRNVYEPTATVTHSGAHATTGESARMIRAHHVSARRFLAKKYPGIVLWPVRAVLGTGLAIRSALITRKLPH